MQNKIVAIAGGSGSGKSTVAVGLCKKYPAECTLIHVDDYFQKSEKAPREGNLINWDHPGAIRFDDLYKDLQSLRDNKTVNVFTKSELYNPDYRTELRNKIEHSIQPKRIIILEGYLALYDERIRDMADMKIFLDMPIEESAKRRSENKFNLNQAYFDAVLKPMYKKFVMPTKRFADLVVEVSDKTKEEVFGLVEKAIFDSDRDGSAGVVN